MIRASVASVCICVVGPWMGIVTNPAGAEVIFDRYGLKVKFDEPRTFDLDGDGLDDIFGIQEEEAGENVRHSLVVFFQDPRNGFSQASQLTYAMGKEPVALWPAALGDGPRQRMLVMKADGVYALNFTDRAAPPTETKLIDRDTLIPEHVENSRALFFPLSADTGKPYPLIIVPTNESIEIWENSSDGWRYALSLQDGPRRTLRWEWREERVYSRTSSVGISVGDVNGDDRDDIVISENIHTRKIRSFSIYEQTGEGRLPSEAVRRFEVEDPSWVYLQDIDGDGSLDVISNKWVREQWFIPGTYSGKVLVRILMSGRDGSIPDSPDYVFRKNDWSEQMPIVDIDGDGDVDLVLGYSHWKGREEVLETVTSKEIDLDLRFHFWGDDGFSTSPDCRKALKLSLPQRNVFASLGYSSVYRYSFERLIDLSGDFNGDGRRDLLARDGARHASVYFFRSKETGFSRRADIRFGVDEIGRFSVRDLNRDGISDIIVSPQRDGDLMTVHLSSRK